MPYLVGYPTPQDFGAAGDGVTDDTAAIQLAINSVSASGGGTLFFPAGTYQVTPTASPALTVPSNIKLVGANRRASTLRKTANGVMVSISGPSTDPTGNTHVRYSSVETLGFDGNNFTGLLFRLYYADNLVFRDVYMVNNLDTCVDTAEFWDSRFYNLAIEKCGGAANSTTPNIQLRNSAASSGFGYSGDNVNQIHLIGCRFEAFYTQGVTVGKGVNSTNNPNGIYITDCKFETSNMQGGPFLLVDDASRGVYANDLYFYAGAFNTGYSTAQNIITWSAQSSALEEVLITNGSTATINSGVDIFSGANGTTVLRNVIGTYNTSPTGAHLFFEASSTADFLIDNCYSNIGTQASGTIPSKWYQNNPLRLVAGTVSDASFSHTPLNGTMALDSTNTRPYFRVGGSWVTQTSTAGNWTVGGTLSAAGVTLPMSEYVPADHGFLAWTYDPTLTTGSSTTTSGTVYLAQVVLRYAATISKAQISLGSAASGVTANQNFVGLYTSAGTRVAVTTAGAIDAALASSGVLTATFATPYSAAAGTYWVAFVNNATTPAGLGRASTLQSTSDANLTAATYRWAVNGTGQTTLPASITPASNTSTNSITLWTAVY